MTTKITQRPFGNVRQLPSGRYQARWRGPDGFHHAAPDTFPSRDAAKVWLAGVRVERAAGLHIDRRDSGETFAAYADGWRARALVTKRQSSRVRDLGYLDRYLLPTFGPMALHDIERDRVEVWLVELLDSGLAPATVSKAGQILGQVLDAAVASGKLGANPARGVKLPRVPRREMVVIGPDQIDQLAEAIDPRSRAMVYVGCYCGLRIGEMVALRVSDVDLIRRTITVTRSMTEVEGHQHLGLTKTSAGRRVVPIPRAVAAELAAHIPPDAHPDDLVFPNTDGDYLRTSNFRNHRWYPAVAAAGLAGMRVHDMRHTAITLWLEAGIDPKQIAAWAGHTSVVTVLDVYGSVRPGRPDAMGPLDALIDASRPAGVGTVTPIR